MRMHAHTLNARTFVNNGVANQYMAALWFGCYFFNDYCNSNYIKTHQKVDTEIVKLAGIC